MKYQHKINMKVLQTLSVTNRNRKASCFRSPKQAQTNFFYIYIPVKTLQIPVLCTVKNEPSHFSCMFLFNSGSTSSSVLQQQQTGRLPTRDFETRIFYSSCWSLVLTSWPHQLSLAHSEFPYFVDQPVEPCIPNNDAVHSPFSCEIAYSPELMLEAVVWLCVVYDA